MRCILLIALILNPFLVLLYGQQVKKTPNHTFNAKEIAKDAATKGITGSELKGYLEYKKAEFSSVKSQKLNKSQLTPGTENVIYIDGNKPMSLGCPNMGFEQFNFNGWSGSTGSVSVGSTFPIYNQISATINNSAGDNVSLLNTTNYHTIMSVAPSNAVYPNCVGYDSLACKIVGTQTVSEIPIVSPFSFDNVSVRMGGALSNKRACKLKYITTSGVNNNRLSYSYALVFQDPNNTSPSHTTGESPYFKVTIKNETTNTELVGCTSYSFNTLLAQPSDSLYNSIVYNGDPVKYRKWYYYTVDLSTLPSGTPVSINFEVGGCTEGGHFCYAYVDAECGGNATPYANMCSGTSFATLVAPTGFSSYQWFTSAGIPIPGATNDTLIQGTTPGTVFLVDMTTPNGCVVTKSVTVTLTTVSIINLNATSSCSGGNSGSATVLASGSNSTYSYTWTNMGNSQIVSNSQTAFNLGAGNYNVLVSSPGCGQASANFAIGVSPPYYYNEIKSFCGNATFIEKTGGSNYQWYHGSNQIPSPSGTNDTLFLGDAQNGDIYTLVYKNTQGCKDSISYILNKLIGGTLDFYPLSNSCYNDSSGSAILNFNSNYNPPYNYNITGPSSSNILYSNTGTNTSVNLNNLPVGSYTAMVNDGTCYYSKVVDIKAVQTNFTLTPQSYTLICFPDSVTVGLNVGEEIPTTCGLSNVPCDALPLQLFTTGPFTQNTFTTYPTPYGNWYTNGRNQYLIQKSDLNAAGITAGKLNSIAFNILSLNGSSTKYNSFSIKIGCTNLTTLPNASAGSQPFVGGLLSVYSHSNQPISEGWQTYNFTQPYNWDNASNIIVEVCFTFPNVSGTGNATENASVELKQMSYIANMYHVEDLNPVCGNTQLANNGIGSPMTNGINMLPNMRFGFCDAISPNDYSVTISSNGTITANYNNDSITIAPNFSAPTGVVVYTVSVFSPIGNCATTKTITAFYPPLNTTVTAIPTTTTLCQFDTLHAFANGAMNYNWTHVASGTSLSTTSVLTVVPPSTGQNVYTVTGDFPCPNSVADTKTITVNVTPKANLDIDLTDEITKCLNKDFVAHANVTSLTVGNPATPFTYSWTQLPGNTPAPGTNSASDYTVSGNSTNTFVVTVNGACAYQNSDTIIVKNFVDDLSVSISNTQTLCVNAPLTMTSTVGGGRPIYNYVWSINSNTVSTTQNLNTNTPLFGGTYTVYVTAIDSCSYSDTASQSIFILPNTLNVQIIGNVNLCGKTPFSLHSQSSGGYPQYSFDWYLLPSTNSISSLDSLSFITPEAEGTYSIQIVKRDSCGTSVSDIKIINVLPPCMVEIPNVITPNGDGANEFFKIKNTEYFSSIGLTIYDRWGKLVYSSSNYKNDWKAEGLNDGTYFYIIDVADDKKYSGFVTVFKD
jgi:gliding motility-associated-like protein